MRKVLFYPFFVLCGGKVSGIVPGRGAKKRDVGMMMTRLGGNSNE